MVKFSSRSIACLALLFTCVATESLNDLKKKYLEFVMECTKEFPVTTEDLKQLHAKNMTEAAKCMLACAYKKTGMMDDHGMLSMDSIKAISEKYLSDEPEKMQKTKQFNDACKGVNDVKVSDGDKGCERAGLLYKCSIEAGSQFDFAT